MNSIKGLPAVYHAGLALAAVATVVLPIIYVAITMLAGYGVYYFAVNYFAEIWEWSIGYSYYTLMLKVVCSCTPLLVGGCISIFMVKPLFARRRKRMDPIALNPDVEPRVYQMVHDVCSVLGAPAPRRIQLDCELNASASFERGWYGMHTNRLILTLGMPLIAGLTQREMAGVIAHEFGHFRQGVGMRFSYLIRNVNGWFMRVIFERDAWDATLDEICTRLTEIGLEVEDVDDKAAFKPFVIAKILTADGVAAMLHRGGPTERAATKPALFTVGDIVRAKDMHPPTHTRLPRYVRGHLGRIEAVRGTHVFPDSNAHGAGENPQWLYTVAFSGAELWADAPDPLLEVTVDAFEPYLERA